MPLTGVKKVAGKRLLCQRLDVEPCQAYIRLKLSPHLVGLNCDAYSVLPFTVPFEETSRGNGLWSPKSYGCPSLLSEGQP